MCGTKGIAKQFVRSGEQLKCVVTCSCPSSGTKTTFKTQVHEPKKNGCTETPKIIKTNVHFSAFNFVFADFKRITHMASQAYTKQT